MRYPKLIFGKAVCHPKLFDNRLTGTGITLRTNMRQQQQSGGCDGKPGPFLPADRGSDDNA